MLIDVAVPEMHLSSLTYESPIEIAEGVRIIVPVQNHLHVGFVTGHREVRPDFELREIEAVIDETPMIPTDIWNMAMYAGRVCFCGAGAALKAILPRAITDGMKLEPPPEIMIGHTNFRERNYFDPFDDERVKFFVNELERPERTLILFPTKERAKYFYSHLPDHIKSESMLYVGGNKLFTSWKSAYNQESRIVIASPAGVFAPSSPQRLIIEDEANPAYIIPYSLNISARSLAGHRAVSLGAELITAGRIPSLKTYIRTHPTERIKPERKNIILADIHHSRKEKVNGIEGNIPLTYSLIKRTYKALMQKHNVIWILGRLGESSEVFCENCGHSVTCETCGHVMKSMNDGNILWCEHCRKSRELPDKCEKCGSTFFKGKRPGIDSLFQLVKKYYNDVHIYAGGTSKGLHGLILSTHRGLELCRTLKPELIAWLDLDLELWRPEYNTRYNTFNMLYESYYRGRKRAKKDSERKILIQARKSGMNIASYLSMGWDKFIQDELKIREEYLQPPYGYIIEIECSKIKRGEIINAFDDAGIFVLDPGDDSQPLYVNVESLDELKNIPELFGIRKSKSLKITLRSE